MKYGFSTLACPSWTFDEIVATAKDFGYDGVEIRGVANELYAPNIKAFSDSIKCKQKLGNLEIPILTSNSCIATKENADKHYNEAIDYINLAEKLGVPYVRIMCTNRAMLDDGDYNFAFSTYKKIANYASSHGVTPLIETNGMFCDTELLSKFMNEVGESNVGVLWDIHHPYRYGRESIKDTINNIGKFIKYVHIKDSVRENGATVYKMLGAGDLPLCEAIDSLKTIGYDGYITLEWVKRWQPDLDEPGIVLARFIDDINRLIKE